MVSYRSGIKHADPAAVNEARSRARRLLEAVAVQIQPEQDEELAGLLREARHAVDLHARHGSGRE